MTKAEFTMAGLGLDSTALALWLDPSGQTYPRMRTIQTGRKHGRRYLCKVRILMTASTTSILGRINASVIGTKSCALHGLSYWLNFSLRDNTIKCSKGDITFFLSVILSFYFVINLVNSRVTIFIIFQLNDNNGNGAEYQKIIYTHKHIFSKWTIKDAKNDNVYHID